MATQADLNAIDKAIASGQRVVQYNGKRVEYRDIAELREARKLIEAQLNRGSGAVKGILSDRTALGSYCRD